MPKTDLDPLPSFPPASSGSRSQLRKHSGYLLGLCVTMMSAGRSCGAAMASGGRDRPGPVFRRLAGRPQLRLRFRLHVPGP